MASPFAVPVVQAEQASDADVSVCRGEVKLGTLGSGSGFLTLRDQHALNEIDPGQLRTLKKLGQGAFAFVEKAELQQKSQAAPLIVAVKRLKPEIVEDLQELEAFVQEVVLMRKLKHTHIVKYIGVGATDVSSASQTKESMFYVQEFMGGGTLKQLVNKQMSSPWERTYSNADALRWCRQVASALAYLHTCSPKVIHRDLKMENILLSADMDSAKLADFGLVTFIRVKKDETRLKRFRSMRSLQVADASLHSAARSMEQAFTKSSTQRQTALRHVPQPPLLTQISTKFSVAPDASVKQGSAAHGMPHHGPAAVFEAATLRVVEQLSCKTGTLMYMAPEMFKEEKYTEAVDVFSFGVIMYELFHRYLTVCAISNAGTEAEIEAYAQRVSEGYRLPIEAKWPRAWADLVAVCWAQNPADRPSMKEVLKRLQALDAASFPEYMGGSTGCGCTIC